MTQLSKPSQHLLLPRSDQRGQQLASKLQPHRVAVSCVEFLSITPVDDMPRLKLQLSAIYQADLIVLVSINAVEQLVQALQQWQWPLPTAPIAVPGKASASVAQQHKLNLQFTPKHKDNSEGLWINLKQHDWRGKNVSILRAQDGRDFLQQKLIDAGANVDTICLYLRSVKEDVAKQVTEAHLSQPFTDILLSSGSICDVWLSQIFQQQPILLQSVDSMKWLVYSQRLALKWKQHFPDATVCVLDGANDEAILQAVTNNKADNVK